MPKKMGGILDFLRDFMVKMKDSPTEPAKVSEMGVFAVRKP